MKLSLRVFFICAALVLAAPQILSAQDPQKPLAIAEGQPIYEQDLMSVAGPSLLDLRKQEYKAKSDALDKVIRMKLVEAEAKKRGLTADELLKQEVDSKVADPSDDEAKGYYLAQRSQTTLPPRRPRQTKSASSPRPTPRPTAGASGDPAPLPAKRDRRLGSGGT